MCSAKRVLDVSRSIVYSSTFHSVLHRCHATHECELDRKICKLRKISANNRRRKRSKRARIKLQPCLGREPWEGQDSAMSLCSLLNIATLQWEISLNLRGSLKRRRRDDTSAPRIIPSYCQMGLLLSQMSTEKIASRARCWTRDHAPFQTVTGPPSNFHSKST